MSDSWPPRLWLSRPLAVLDCESTGVDPQTARIVQLAFVRVLPNGSIDPTSSLCTLVNPGVPIPPEATAVHGISDDHVSSPAVPDTRTALGMLSERIGWSWEAGDCLAVMNAPYDLPLVAAEWSRAGAGAMPWTHPVLDPLVMDRHLDRYRKGRRNLSALCQHYGVPLAEAHDARADAIATAGVVRAISFQYPSIARMAPRALHAAQVGWYREWRDGINAYWARSGDQRRVDGEWPGVPAWARQ